MSEAAQYLPGFVSELDICSLLAANGIGRPRSIQPLKVTAAFHIIYVLTFDAEAIEQRLSSSEALATLRTTGTIDLILRIAGDHLPCIKTENEAAVLFWVKANTNIPVPEIVAHDATTSNIVQREWMLCTRSQGIAVSDVYEKLSQPQLDGLLNQMIDILIDLQSQSFSEIGGLKFNEARTDVVAGPIVDETFWFNADIEKYLPGLNLQQINVGGPFTSYTSYTAAALRSHMHVARSQQSLSSFSPFLSRLEKFIAVMPEHASVLDDVPIRLAHRDLHFANILFDSSTGLITAVLDWEFAGTFPCPRWDPSRAFLWNGSESNDSLPEKYRLRARYEKICRERGVEYLLQRANFTSTLQEGMHDVLTYVRCIVSCVPRGQCADTIADWEKELDQALKTFNC